MVVKILTSKKKLVIYQNNSRRTKGVAIKNLKNWKLRPAINSRISNWAGLLRSLMKIFQSTNLIKEIETA